MGISNFLKAIKFIDPKIGKKFNVKIGCSNNFIMIIPGMDCVGGWQGG